MDNTCMGSNDIIGNRLIHKSTEQYNQEVIKAFTSTNKDIYKKSSPCSREAI